jgi:hypothetical protein
MVSPTQLPSTLTKTIQHQTQVPFVAANGSTNTLTQLNICSEFVSHVAPVTPLQPGKKLGLVPDLNGQPMVFVLGNDKVVASAFVIDFR